MNILLVVVIMNIILLLVITFIVIQLTWIAMMSFINTIVMTLPQLVVLILILTISYCNRNVEDLYLANISVLQQ